MVRPTPEALPAVAGRGHVALVTGLAAAVLLPVCRFPDRFSIPVYVIGAIAFIAAGQGAPKRLA